MHDAYEGLRVSENIVLLYRSGYLDVAQKDRDISEYAYKRGALVCSNSWMPNAAIARLSLPTARHWLPTYLGRAASRGGRGKGSAVRSICGFRMQAVIRINNFLRS